MTLRLRGSSSQYVDITASPNAGDATLTLPTDSGTVRVINPSGVDGDYTVATGATISGPTNTITASTNGSERLRITSSGDVTTTGADYTRANAGFTARAGDSVNVTRASGTPLEVNRTGSDGTIVNFFQDGSVVGSIGVDGNDLWFGANGSSYTESFRITSGGGVGIGTSSADFSNFGSNTGGAAIQDIGGTNTGLKIGDGSNHNYFVAAGNGSFYQSHYGSGSMIFGVGASGTERMRINNAGKLILPTGSPGIQFGATDSGGNITSQTLDDYEEGTFTPEIFGLNAATKVGHYVKVGNLVTCIFYIDISTKTYIGSGTDTTSLQIILPFTNSNTTTAYAGASIGNVRNVDFSSGSVKQFAMNIGGSSDRLTGRWIKHNSNFVDVLLVNLYNSFSIHASVTYKTA